MTPCLDKPDYGVSILMRDVDDASSRGSHHGAVVVLERIFFFRLGRLAAPMLTIRIKRAGFQKQTTRLCVKELCCRGLRCAVRALEMSHNQMRHCCSCDGC
ncbi:hypothetical protein PSAC2689_20274 [Paraburkholderia sacchari]